jgi:hypothetical protein
VNATEVLPFITNGGAIGVLSWVFWQVLRGNLIPKSTHDKALEEANARAETWKQVALTYKQSVQETQGTVPAQLETAHTVEKFVEAIRQMANNEETKGS